MTYQVSMHRSQHPRTGLALGGIGAGWFEIRQDGGFRHWEIFNNWPLFTGERFPWNEKQALFFMLRVKVEHENPRLVLLQIEDGHDAAAIERHEFHYMFPWISGVDVIHFKASVPFADLDFEQEDLPLKVHLKAWSPFIPGNVKDSALPLACFDFDIESTGTKKIDVQLLATARNMAGYDQPERIYVNRRVRDGNFSAVVMENAQMDPKGQTTGSLCLASFDSRSTAYSGWEHHHPYYERLLREDVLPEFDDTNGRNNEDKKTGKKTAAPRCFVTIGRAKTLPPGETFSHGFALTWHFPNLYGRPSKEAPNFSMDNPCGYDRFEGHAYSRHFNSAEAVARYAFAEHARLLGESAKFHRCFFDSSLPDFVLDQINSHLNTFRTSTWLTETGMYGVLEGLSHTKPYAGIGTTDVAMYGQIATSLLFPELDRMTVDIWRKFQNPDSGIVIHAIACNSYAIPKDEASGHRLDMPAQFVFQTLRAALWSGNNDYLKEVWPNVKSALGYVLRERDKNKDRLPDMEGIMCSYDNFPMFGVAPFVVSQWLAAVDLSLKAAGMLGDQAFIAEYSPFLEQGRKTLEGKTWNGAYFKIYSDHQASDPEGENGCMVDQLVGDGVRCQLGLSPVVDPAKARKTFEAILSMNYKPDQGLRNCQWPGDTFLHDIGKDTWVDQANTCWTGVELNFAAQLYYAGMWEEAEMIIRNVDERHRKWGIYFDHQEFGGHYFRPMSALAIPNAFLGLSFDGVTLRFDPARSLPEGRWCVLLPAAYGTLSKTAAGAKLKLCSGSFAGKRIDIRIPGIIELACFGDGFESAKTETGTEFTRS